MDDSLKKLETDLEKLIPRSLSDDGRDRCHSLIDDLTAVSTAELPAPVGWSKWNTGIAAAAALLVGVSSGWFFGSSDDDSISLAEVDNSTLGSVAADFEELDRETWLVSEGGAGVYVSRNGDVREISHEVEVTKEIVQHRESGVIVTVETKDHHVVDSVKSDF